MIALGMASTSLDRSRQVCRVTLTSVVAAVSLAVVPTASARAAPSGPDTPDPCAGAPATIAAQQAAFTTLAGFGGGWSTADGYVPVPLPDRRTAWLMSDTLVAPPVADPAAGPTFVHNSIVVQRGNCFTPVMGGTAELRDDLVPTADQRACWQSAGVARATSLVVFCTEVENVEGPPGFGFRVVGTALATFDLPSLTFTGRVPLPFVEAAGIRWGTGAVLDGDWVYVYGTTADAQTTNSQFIARVRFDRLAIGPWRFWTGTAWGEREALVPMTFAGATPAMPAFVTPTDRGYVAVAFSSPFPDPTITGWTAVTPQGPWQRAGTVATASTLPGQYAYDARAVDLGRAGWAVVYNVNDPVAVASDPTVYGGRFVAAPRMLQRAVQGATKR
jgi:hypothetical protein